MRWLPRPKFIYVSPWLLAAATGLLVLIVVTFAVSNMQREKRLMTNAMLQKAATLMRVIQSGARASYLSDLRRGIWNLDPWYDHVQRVIDHLTDDPDLSFLAVVDHQGEVLAHSLPEMRGQIIPFRLPKIPPAKKAGTSLIFHVVQEKSQGRFFEVIRPFSPFRPAFPRVPLSLQELNKQFPGAVNNRFAESFSPGKAPGEFERFFVLVALDMKRYDQALGRLRFQVLMLSLAMLLVGVGGWLSLAAVQGYRVSQKTLNEIQAFTGLLVAGLPVGIIATDKRELITTWNQAAAELTGIQQEAALGTKPQALLPPVLAVFFSKSSGPAEKKKDQEGKQVELVVDGNTVILDCHHLIITDEAGHPEGKVLLLSNMTKLKNLEKEMRKNERLAAVGKMAAGVAHEVRNPLSSVKGLALLLQGKFSRQSNEHETAMLLIQEVERMNRTISDLLSFARPAPLVLARVDLGDLLERQVKLLEADATSSGITFHLKLSSDLFSIAADRDRLNQVVMNILLNAVQSMPDGGEVIVQAGNTIRGSAVSLTVTDTGIGMDAETLNQVFFPYFTTKKGGTGIGLAISQKIIADHGGHIRLHSVLGQGTIVTVELPRYGVITVPT